MSLLLTAPSRPFLCSVLVTCWSHHFFTLLYFAFIEFANMTQHGHRDKKGFTLMKGFTTPPGSMPPWIMGQEKVLDWDELRVLISLTGHSFERQRPGHSRKVDVGKKGQCHLPFHPTAAFASPRYWVCAPQPWDYSCRMSFLLGGFSPDPDFDIASIVVVFFPLQPK